MSTLIKLIHVLRRTNGSINKIKQLNQTNLKYNPLINRILIDQHYNYSTKLCDKHPSKSSSSQNVLLKVNHDLVLCKSIRTTNPNRLPPIFWLVLRPVLNLVAVLGGRRFRY